MRRTVAALLAAASLLACGGSSNSDSGTTGPTGPTGSTGPSGPTLRSLATGKLHLGVAVATDPLRSSATYAGLIGDQFDMVVAENVMKFDQVEPSRGNFQYGNADSIVAFAQAHGMTVRGHTLLWHSQSAWLFGTSSIPQGQTGTLPAGVVETDLPGILANHINNVVGHFKGKVACWDVVNEALTDNYDAVTSLEGAIRDDAWAHFYQVKGETITRYRWIEDAFRAADAVDPDVKLFYNDYGAEALGSPKGEYLYQLVKQLKDDGVPIDGVGFQMHIGLAVPAGFADQVKRFTDLGLEVHITEADVGIKNNPPTDADLAQQKQVYQSLMEIALANPKVTAVLVWGLDDGHTWRTGKSPLLFDGTYHAKPAFYGVQAALQAASSQ